MAATYDSNVISFDRNTTRVTPITDSATHGLLYACRDRLFDGVSAEFSCGMGDARAQLFELADRAFRIETQTLYLAAQRAINNNGAEILECFRDLFNRSFDTSLKTLRGNVSLSVEAECNELSLVADSEFEKDLAVGKLSSLALYNCFQQLTALDRRVAIILGAKQIRQDSNPLIPRALYSAFLGATKEMDLDGQIGITLLQEFDRQVRDKLPMLYANLNKFLVARDILPKLPLAIEHEAGSAAAAELPGPPAIDAIVDDAPSAAKKSVDDIFLQLASGFQNTQAQSRSNTESSDWKRPAPMRTEIIEALTGIQREKGHSCVLPRIQSQHSGDESSATLRQIRRAPFIRNADPNDAVTVDIVAALFDYVLSYSDFPHALRNELSRLQVPVLKAAFMDKAFFVDDKHPARYLLDLIVSSSVGWSKKDAPRYYAKIRSIVDEIVSTFEKDVGVLSSKQSELESFVAEEDKRARQNSGALAREIDRQDGAKDAKSAATTQIRRHLDNADLPNTIREFLTKIWRLMLVLAFARSGKESAAWNNAVKTMDELIWSVTPKRDPQQRKRFFVLLPDLLQRLHEGIQTVGLARSNEDSFFSRLAYLHANAVNPDSRNEEELQDREDDADIEFTEAGESLEQSIEAELTTVCSPQLTKVDEESPEDCSSLLQAGTGTSNADRTDAQNFSAKGRPDEDENTDLIQQLRLGTWVEFTSERGTKATFRLSWISGSANIYLFADRQGHDALTLSADRLSIRLREGSARVFNGKRLTARAIGSMLKSTELPAQK